MAVKIGEKCPLTRRKCMEYECRLWRPIRVSMPHPQIPEKTITEEEWDCVFALQLITQLDTARKVNQAGAATESMRNQIVDRMDKGPFLQLPKR